MKILKDFINNRSVKISIIIILQILGVFLLIKYFNHASLVYNITLIINFCIGISILSKNDLNPIYKLMWICILSLLPVVGSLIYLLWGDRKITRRMQKQMSSANKKSLDFMNEFCSHFVKSEVLSGGEKASAKYLESYAEAPVFTNTDARYFSCGEDFFVALKQELEKAEKFIFMEYFIIKQGAMWDEIYDILKKKAKQGVEIRIIYDAFGSMFHLPDDFIKNCEAFGIKCQSFNGIKFTAIITEYTFLNHRDHRKICVIDGNTGFTGGINIADEYININTKCGHWKDTAVMLRGDAVISLTTTFLKMWGYLCPETDDDFIKYLPTIKGGGDFYVQPYEDTPADVENVSENSYFNVIYHARNYVYITTPYLIIDYEMIVSLSIAAKSGVDVRIIVPGIPDKKYAYYITQSFYPELIRAGVKIYEYTPGFMHAKMFVRDDEQAIVGTANMDYRSLYLHFENCCAFYGGDIVKDVRNDFEKLFEVSHRITPEDLKTTSKFKRLIQLLLKFFSPIM